MIKGIAAPSGQNSITNRSDSRVTEKEGLSEFFAHQLNGPVLEISETGLPWNEQELLREAILSVTAIRFGSISLVIHEGHLVEVSKTIRIRNGPIAAVRKRESKG